MAGGTTHRPQQDPQLAPPSSTAPTTTSEEDELLKRNTDCVYFLASPLTCKKGSECEYRHSDIARVNPRDCWYWLNGSCLNPKCGFRHPPLDGLLGADVSTPMGASVPAPHAAPYAMPKQGVACIFFQKGFCLKGHLCPFSHGPPNSVNNKAAQSGSANPVTEPPKMASSGPEKSFQEQKFTQQATVQKPVEFLLPQGKQAPRMQAPLPANNGGNGGGDKKAPSPSSMGVEEPPRYKSGRVVPPPVMNETPSSKPNRGVYHAYHASDNDRILNGKDADEYSREPSPGFDVLVDNELGDSEYYHNKDDFGRTRGNDYDLDRPTDYDVDREMYREQRDYDHYNERDGLKGEQHAWDDRRSSCERMLVGSAHLERRPYPRSDSPDHFDGSDLRHRISKQRRGSDNGLRSVVSREYAREGHADRMPRRDSHHHRSDQGALSSRLRGRIKIPGSSISPTNENDSRMEREIDIGRRHPSRYSPGRPPSINQSRLRDRIKGRVSDDNNSDAIGSRGHRDMMSDNDTKFTGPKRLSELKSGRSGEQQAKEGQVVGKRKYPRVEEDLSFEGPKPLSEILKRKRGGETNPISSVNTKDNNQKKEREIVAEKKSVSVDLEPEKETGSINTEKDKSCINYENEGGVMDEDALLDEELEAYDHREGEGEEEGEYEYEQIDGEEDYNLDEGEYEDGDEYGKKEEGVVY